VETLGAFGFDVGFDRVRPLIGMGADKLLPTAVGLDSESPLGKEMVERRGALFLQKYLPTLRPFPGSRALVERVRRDGMVCVVASSANEEELRPLLKAAQVDDLMDAKTSSDDAERSKPDPDIVAAAVKRSGLHEEHLIMLGDTPYDVEAAQRAGVRIIALRCGGWSDAALVGAIRIYDTPENLLSEYEQSPLGTG
jgi:HAD superfamily hydrolase (TIGR01509 family)